MSSRKRGRAEMESPGPQLSLLQRIRNCWEFSNLMQFIFIFGRAVKIDDDLTIDDLETECLRVEPSAKLVEIGLALLKCVSSHRGLTPDIFDEYTRRQYVAKAPERNPFGVEETPKNFLDFDIFTKLSVLCQLSRWTFVNSDRMREKMSETMDLEQIQWRIEEIGYDKEERYYFVLDDNRLYRRTDPPPPPPPASKPKAKANSKKAKAAARASKRRKTKESQDTEHEDEEEIAQEEGVSSIPEEHSFGGRKWECIAVTLADYNAFLESIKKSRDPDEKALYKRVTEEVLPIIEKDEESKQRRQARKERELMNVERLATAKRSSRLASKFETERSQREAAEAERKRKADIAAALAHEEKQKMMEEARESRMMTREQRLKEREHKRVLHEEELTNLSEDSKKVETGEARMSERQLKTEMEKRKRELAALDDEDAWTFDCAKCGIHGENLDDGTHSVACDKCNVWQHSACLGVSQADAEQEDFHFVCQDCRRRAEDAAKPKIPPLKFHLGSSSSPPNQKSSHSANDSKKRKSFGETSQMPPLKKFKPVEVHPSAAVPPNTEHPYASQNGMHQAFMNGPTLSPQGQMPNNQGSNPAQTMLPPGLRSPPGPPAYSNGYTHSVPPRSGSPYQHMNGTPAYRSDPHQVNGASHSSGGTSGHHSQQTPQRPTFQPSTAVNPYLNTFDRVRPGSSQGSNLVTPSHQDVSISSSPPMNQYNTPKLSPYTDGISTSTPMLPAAVPAPVKQQTSPPPSTLRPPSSSPINHPPLHNNAPSSPGFSPTKQSPPRPPPSLGAGATPVLPPVANLAPSPKQQDLHPPIKPLNLARPTAAVNGHADHH
ncbi:MAG: hypothetical protein LQ348_003065 [Seirophora lacunosa]|nr:MAG: hypothetical protein LQ348_003065 [Seirophora lacunosa]